MDLRANTAVDVLIGPFIDKTDGNTTEDALTLTAAEIKLSKNGQALALKSDVTSAVFDDDGYYNCELDATDTNTEGNMVLIVHQSANALPVRHEFNVLAEAAWDSLYVAKDTGFMDVNIKAIADATASVPGAAGGVFIAGTNAATTITTALTTTFTGNLTGSVGSLSTTAKGHVQSEVDTAIATARLDELASADAGGTKPTVGSFFDQVMNKNGSQTFSVATDSLEAQADAVLAAAAIADAVWDEPTVGHATASTTGKALTDTLADTNELQGDWVNGGRLDVILDARMAEASISTTAGAVDNVTLVATTTTNTDVRGTDGANTTTPPTAAAIADAVLDEATSGHTTGGSFAVAVTDILADTGTDGVQLASTQTVAWASSIEASAGTIVEGAAAAGTLTTTTMTTNLTEATDDHYNGRSLIFTGGALAGQATDITDYTGATKLLTYTAITEAPVASTSTFVIV